MKAVCELNKCVGCMACLDVCMKKAIILSDQGSSFNALINSEVCVDCGRCKQVCQECNRAELKKPLKWYQGWATSNRRIFGNSGGFAGQIAEAFILDGGIIYSCAFEAGDFRYISVTDVNQIHSITGSKYVKINASGVYKRIHSELIDKKKVLFIGLPCQVASLKNFIGKKLSAELYTIDLICHGTPSSTIFKKYLEEHCVNLNQISDIRFRKYLNQYASFFSDYSGIEQNVISDHYSIAFLKGVSFTACCYDCNYARIERVGDITLGDSWGNSLEGDEKKKGISLALCQTEKGIDLLKKSRVHIESVDLKIAIENNLNLKEPMKIPNERNNFFLYINKGVTFDRAVDISCPLEYFKQKIKIFLLKTKIIQDKASTHYYIMIK